MWRGTLLLLGLWALLGSALGDLNETNILKISRQSRPNHRDHAASNSTEFVDRKRKNTLVAFSKNNPEQDWKKYLQVAESEEQDSLELDLDFAKDELRRTANSIQWLSDLYDPLSWSKVPGKLSERCRSDMDRFLQALRDGEPWAAKTSDASGRYSSQFHFGNGFWLGSSTLCRELNMTIGGGILPNETPPYPLRFFVARMYITLPSDLELSTSQVFLGLCLPSSCDKASIHSLLKTTSSRVEREGNFTHKNEGPKIRIVNVKPVPSNDYCPWKDPKFFVLGGVAGTIVLLMLWSMIYEYRYVQVTEDIESSCATNNNERISTYMDKNLVEDGRLPGQRTDKELVDQLHNGNKKVTQDCLPPVAESKEKGFWVKCLLAFSPIKNGSKIISTDPAARDNLTCLHGLRVFSLGWVVMVHTYLEVFSIAENKTLRSVTERNFMFQTISNATFSVDTFFFISGLLVTVLFYRSIVGGKIDKLNFAKTCTNKFFVMLLYRFIRLTPAYLFVLGVNEVLIKYYLSNTVFSPGIIDHLTCEKFWWRNALYINSLYPRTELCMLWSWYMANDTQFYVLGIFLLLLSVKYFKFVAGAVCLIIVSSWFTTFSIAYANDYVARIQEPFALFDELYDKPWLRAGPYFVGTVTGYLLYKTNCQLRMPTMVKTVGWILSPAVMFSVVYGLYPANLNIGVSSIYASLGHTAWALAVAFIVIQCCTGSAPIIDSLLSLRLVYPLSRLTYCAYLVHPVIMMITSTQMDGPLHIHNGVVLIVYFGNLVASYLVSFCVSLALEAPIVNLLKIALAPKKQSNKWT